jgi:hypothetical protein
MENKSYLQPDEKTYSVKFLGAKNSALKITDLEVIGFGGDDALQMQLNHREIKKKEINKARKIDKKMMIEGEVGGMLFEKTL